MRKSRFATPSGRTHRSGTKRQTLEQSEGSAPGALAKPETDDCQNQTRRLSS